MSPIEGGGGCGVSANEYSYANGTQINFGDLTPYLTYGVHSVIWAQMALASLVAISGPKKVSIFRPTPFNSPRIVFALIKIITSRAK